MNRGLSPAYLPVIRSASLAGYAQVATSLGLPTTALLRKAGLTRQVLEQPDQPISLRAVCELLEQSAQQSGCESFGLRLAANRRLAHLGTVSVVLRELPTGLQALQSLSRYLCLVNPSLLTHVQLLGSQVMVREEIITQQALPVRQPLEMAVGVMHGVLRELLSSGDVPWKPKRVCFRHRAPLNMNEHKRYFACPIEFNAEFDGLLCNTADLERELPDRDSGRASAAQWALDRALQDMLHQATQDTAQTVRQLLAILLPQGQASVTQVAATLSIDRRTLARYLALQNTSFTQLLHEVRTQLAQRQLSISDHSIGQIAHWLGFGSTSAFAHWFAHQHGISAQRWRELQRQTASNPAQMPAHMPEAVE